MLHTAIREPYGDHVDGGWIRMLHTAIRELYGVHVDSSIICNVWKQFAKSIFNRISHTIYRQ